MRLFVELIQKSLDKRRFLCYNIYRIKSLREETIRLRIKLRRTRNKNMTKIQALAFPAWPVGRSERSVFNTILAAVLAAVLILSLIPSLVIAQTSPPTAPSNLGLNGPVSASTIPLAWTDNSTNETHFVLYKKLTTANTYVYLTQLGSNVTNYTDISLPAGTSYDYSVQACLAGSGCSGQAYLIGVSTSGGSSGSSCTGLTLTFANNKTSYVAGENVDYTWTCTPSGNASYVMVQLVNSSGAATTYNTFTGSANTMSLGFSTSNLAVGSYTLRACFTSTCSPVTVSAGFSVAASSSGGSGSLPSSPSALTTSISGSNVTLTWTDNSSNETEFKVFDRMSGTTTWNFLNSVGTNVTSAVHINAPAGTHEYYVLACTSSGCSGTSNVVFATVGGSSTTPPPPPPPPSTYSGITAPSGLTTSVSGSNVNFTWTDNSSNETEFKVFDRMSGTTTWNFLNSVGTNVTSAVHTNAPAGTHEYYVLACTSSGCSGTSNVVFATVGGSSGVPTAPSNLRLAGPTSASTIPLAWNDNSTNEDKFNIDRKLTSASTYTFLIQLTGSNTTTYTDIGLPAGTSYDYRVQACLSGSGCSAYTYLDNVSATGTAVSQPAPRVESWGASVGTDGKSTIGIGFNTEMDRSTFTAQNVFLHKATDPATILVPGTMQTSDFYINLISSNPLVAGVEYISVIKAGVKNKAGASLASDYTCKFTAVASGYYAGCPAAATTYNSSLVGTVTDSAGSAVSNVGIHVFASNFTMSFGGMTDANGSYVISLPPATYMLEFYPPYNRTDLIKPSATTVAIMDGESKRFNFQFSLVTTVAKVISGTIRFSNGQPVTDAEVGAYNETTNSWTGAVTDSLGSFKFMVGTGKHKVSFRPRNPMTASWQWPGYFQDVEFTGDAAETRVLDFIVPTFDSKIIVTVIDDQGLTLPNAGIMLEQENSPAQYRRTEADGKAVFLVTPGKYILRGYLPTELGFVNPNPQFIEVGSVQTQELTLKFTKLTAASSVALFGKVSLEDGSAVSDAFIWAWSEQGGNAYGRTNVNGEFTIIVPYAGSYHVGAGREVAGFPYKSGEITINTEHATTGMVLTLVQYSATAFPKSVDIVKSVVETIVAQAQDGLQVVIPAQAAGTSGTVNVEMTPTIEVASSADAKVVGTVWQIDIKDQIGTAIKSFTDDLEITFPYDQASLLTEGVNIDALKPNYYDDTTGAWVEISDYTLDKDNQAFVIRINHLTRFALLAPADTTPPAMPSEISYQLTAATQVTLTWVDPKADFHHTRVSRSESISEPGSILSELVTGSRYIDSAVSIGQTYYYYLEAVDAAGNSSQASELLTVTVTGSTSGPSTPIATGASVDKYPSGLLFKYANNPTVYLLQNGVKYPITDFSVFKNHVSGSRSIVTIPASVTFQSGNNVTLKSGTLIKAKSDPTVFLVIENKKRPFTSAEEFLGLGYRFHQIQAIDNNAVAAMPTTGDLARPSGTIFKYAGRATIYMLEDGKKRAFPSTAVLKAWVNSIYVITMPDSELYSDGTTMGLPSGVLVRGLPATIYLVFGSTLRPLVSTKIMTSLGFRSNQIIRVSASDLKLHSVGEPIQ